MISLENIGLFLQIGLCCVGLIVTLRLFKLINHGNAWWIMSLGFLLLLASSFFGLFGDKRWGQWYNVRVVIFPILIRLAFVISVVRIYIASQKEHNKLKNVEGRLEKNLKRIKYLTDRFDSIVVNCPHWDAKDQYCKIETKKT